MENKTNNIELEHYINIYAAPVVFVVTFFIVTLVYYIR
jgi:hypothetical protein